MDSNVAEHDDWSTVVGWLGNSPFDAIPMGLYLSIMCAEDVPQIDFSSSPPMDLGVLSTTQLKEMCEIWITEPVPRRYPIGLPIYQQCPSGANDRHATGIWDLALSQLRNATHMVVSGRHTYHSSSLCV